MAHSLPYLDLNDTSVMLHRFTTVLFLLAVFLFVLSCSEAENEEEPPNIIIILTDDQAWGDLSYNGNSNLSTPYIDSIAYQGAVIENFYVQPVCSPTRAELLTGQHFPKLGVYSTSAGGERMNLGVPTMAEVFKKEGYATAAYGKWHNGTQPPYHPNSRGFDDYYGFCSGHWGNYFNPMLEHNGEITKGEGFLVNDIFEHGMEFIDQQKDGPFFVYFPINTPHSPMQVPDTFWNRFKDKPIEKTHEDENPLFTKAALAMVENIDWNVGRLTTYLKEKGLEENTIVLFMSDNGPASWRWNGGLRGKKGSTDEGGVKSPFFIKWPNKIAAGTQSKQLMGAVDLLPTLAHLAGVSLSDSLILDGSDLSASLLDKNPEIIHNVVYNHWNGNTSVRTQNYRLDDQNRLYDMNKDVGQKMDLAIDNPTIRDSLVALKNRWEKEVNTIERPTKKRLFPLGDSKHGFAQLPARDGLAHGEIKRSNRWPNDSFFTNWIQENDSITWDVEVLNDSHFEIYLYYTCTTENIGTTLKLDLNGESISKEITEAYDPPLIGASDDRYPRMESYVKDFKPIKLGELFAKKGVGQVRLKATSIPGSASIDFRLLHFVRKD